MSGLCLPRGPQTSGKDEASGTAGAAPHRAWAKELGEGAQSTIFRKVLLCAMQKMDKTERTWGDLSPESVRSPAGRQSDSWDQPYFTDAVDEAETSLGSCGAG